MINVCKSFYSVTRNLIHMQLIFVYSKTFYKKELTYYNNYRTWLIHNINCISLVFKAEIGIHNIISMLLKLSIVLDMVKRGFTDII